MVVLLGILGIAVLIGAVVACVYSYFAYEEGDSDNRYGRYQNVFISPFNRLYDYGQGKTLRALGLIERNRIRSEQNVLKREIRADRKTNKGVKSDG